MDIFNTAQSVFDKGVSFAETGVSAAMRSVSDYAIEKQPFVEAFARMCADAFQQGWHEANGGNLSYLLTAEESAACAPYFSEKSSPWEDLDQPCLMLAGSHVLVTASGKHFRNVALNVQANAGIVEIGPLGETWRMVWGFDHGAKPTSELGLHLSCLEARISEGKEGRVAYHAHPAQVMALTALLPVDSRGLTLVLWQGIAEGIIAMPQGVVELPWMVPGTPELAKACAEGMRGADAVVAVNHGAFCCCDSFDSAFGLMHTMDKAAQVNLLSRAANGGWADFKNKIAPSELRRIVERYELDAASWLADLKD